MSKLGWPEAPPLALPAPDEPPEAELPEDPPEADPPEDDPPEDDPPDDAPALPPDELPDDALGVLLLAPLLPPLELPPELALEPELLEASELLEPPEDALGVLLLAPLLPLEPVALCELELFDGSALLLELCATAILDSANSAAAVAALRTLSLNIRFSSFEGKVGDLTVASFVPGAVKTGLSHPVTQARNSDCYVLSATHLQGGSMTRVLPLSLSVIGLALLTACGSRQPQVVVVPPAPVVTQAPAAATPTTPVVSPAATLRPGFGRIESMANVSTAASAGGSAPTSMQRLNIRMDDGSMQVVDTTANVAIGDRVELTREGFIRRHPQ